MPMGPEPGGFAAFVLVRLARYSGVGRLLTRAYDSPVDCWKIGVVRTAIGIGAGLAYFAAWTASVGSPSLYLGTVIWLTRRVDSCVRATAYGLVLIGLCGCLAAQTLEITSPADGSVVYSGQPFVVAVRADSSAFRKVTVSGPHIGGSVVLTAPPYNLAITVPADYPSGPHGAITAFAIPTGGGNPVIAVIRVAIERPDLPRRLELDLPTVDFRCVCGNISLGVMGVFADGTRVGLEHSTYIQYSSDTPAVATVDEQGLVTPVAPGNATITITYAAPSKGSLSAKVPVTVPRSK